MMAPFSKNRPPASPRKHCSFLSSAAFIVASAFAIAALSPLPATAQSVASHGYAKGSGVLISSSLSNTQVANLVVLGKVWGFLKYHHPAVTAGKFNWDNALFDVLPSILAAADRPSANTALAEWIEGLGSVPPCNPCVTFPNKNLALRPDLGWIHDASYLGERLSGLLSGIYTNRTGNQFYVDLAEGIGNPLFVHETVHSQGSFPDAGLQLLGLFRFWNIIEYWYPNRNITGTSWDQVLADLIPGFAAATNFQDYQLMLMRAIAAIHDTHANLWSSIATRPPSGACRLPLHLRFVQNQAVVAAFDDGVQASGTPFQIGDVIVELDGQTVADLVAQWAPYYGASNPVALRRQIAMYMTRGDCGDTSVTIQRNGNAMPIQATRERINFATDFNWWPHDLPGPTFQLLSPQVAYLKLSSVKVDEAAHYIQQAAGTKGLIIDIRNYPSEFVVYALGALLASKQTPFVRFAKADLRNPGAFYWAPPATLFPENPHYAGKLIVLVDNRTQSQAEFTTMAFRAAGATVVGSTTAGADGDVSNVPLPGELRAYISGTGIFYPDKTPTQRVGIVPDVIVNPTITDIADGVDPVLEKAISLIVGPNVSAYEIRKMYQTRSQAAQPTH